ncbi:MAG TPA: dCMP deaminase family protein [Candidatus Woesebacteria bacterium]|nr:dCMP deaminase family protein [Candidatus Woesebacteria bacterium]HRS22773.1 dCMP deaminase family protein [Candidatus Woesebacteria bacterium]HRT40343.1 dCMP deaminase family protein [Candidatus Woesebacteria bacterium]
MNQKIDKDEYYLKIAEAIALKSNCLSAEYGALIVKDDAMISAGYVGAPRKTMDCIDLGYCIRRKNRVPSGTGYEMCRSVHAEMNAIINAARAGVSVLGGDMYIHAKTKMGVKEPTLINAYPCLLCKKMIINAGLKRVICNNQDGSHSVYLVEDWIKDWQEIEDIRQDKVKYGVDYYNQKN